MAADEPTAAHAEHLHHAVASASRTAQDLRGFLGALYGADPVVALASLGSLGDAQPSAGIQALLESARTPLPRRCSELPIVHPLDYAWLFAAESQSALVQTADDCTQPHDLIVYLGCPTVHERALNELPDRRHLLLDRDERRVDAGNRAAPGSAQRVDLLIDPLPDVEAALVIADPPWYPAPAMAFLNAAAILLRPDGLLVTAFADLLTRPGAERDLSELFNAVAQHGLELLETRHGACRYQTPPFEQAALETAGCPGIPADWRLGTLTTMRRRFTPPPRRVRVEEPRWIAHEIQDVPLRTRVDAPARGARLLEPLLGGASLPSVSRRDPRRSDAALWSSRNRIYASSDPPALAQTLRALIDGKPGNVETDVEQEIARLVALERREHGLPERRSRSRRRAA